MLFAWMQAFLFLQILQSTSYIHFIATQLQVDSASCLRQKISCLYKHGKGNNSDMYMNLIHSNTLACRDWYKIYVTVDSTAYGTYSSQFIWGGHNLSLEVIIAK